MYYPLINLPFENVIPESGQPSGLEQANTQNIYTWNILNVEAASSFDRFGTFTEGVTHRLPMLQLLLAISKSLGQQALFEQGT